LRKPPGPAGDEAPDDDPIEILEVVGVDETTGAEVEDPAAGRPEGAGAPHRAGDPQALNEALKEKDKYYDLLLRKQAEFENFRKRMEKERDEFRQNATVDLVKRLLPVLDNLERAIGTGQHGGVDALHQGVALIHQQILEVLRKEGVQTLEALGAPFDPRLHEAVEVLAGTGFEPGVVMEEVQKGYILNDRLLRPALVKVSAGGTTDTPEPGAAGDGDNGGRHA
jgi:molecular chaperone GrpE